MAEYQNIFTQVQVQGPAEMGVVADADTMRERTKGTRFSTLLGLFGNAQIGPVHLGSAGMIAVIGFAAWFFIIGMNFWAEVGYSPGLSSVTCSGCRWNHRGQNTGWALRHLPKADGG